MQNNKPPQDETVLQLGIVADTSTGKVVGVVDDLRLNTVKHYQGTMPQVVDDARFNSYKWADWGADNMLPTRMRCKLESVNIAMATLCKTAYRLYGQGLVHRPIEGGTNVASEATVERFLRRNRIRTEWLPAQILNWKMHLLTFTECIMSRQGNKVASMYHKHSEHCRFERMDDMGRINNVFYSPEFSENGYPDKKRYKRMRLYQWQDEERFLQQQRNQRAQKPSFIMATRLNTPGTRYYPTPFSKALFQEGGWLDVAANVPRIVCAMQNNQISLKYQVCIPKSYFVVKYGDNWETKSNEEKQRDYDEVVSMIEQCLLGKENRLSTLTQQIDDSPESMFGSGKIQIIAIDNTKTAQNDWIPSTTEADKQIAIGMGEHPEQLGMSGEGKLTTANGSSQRESWNAAVQLGKMDLEFILSTLNCVSYINGWNREFYIGQQLHTTKDNSETGLGANTEEDAE